MMNTPQGTCYEDAFRRFLDEKLNSVGGARLIHGEVNDGTGARITHAWLEGREQVWDPQLNGAVSLSAYYDRFQPVVHQRYSREQARLAMLRANHYGPWAAPPSSRPPSSPG